MLAFIVGYILVNGAPYLTPSLFEWEYNSTNVSLMPALVILGAGANPTWALVISQVVLSLGIPFAVIPLVRLTSDRTVMGEHVNSRPTQVVAWTVVALIVALNIALLALTFSGQV